MQISPKKLENILSQLSNDYHLYIRECVDFIEQELPPTILQEIISDHLLAILHTEGQMEVTPLRAYWFQRLQDLLYVGELIYQVDNASNEKEADELNSEIAAFWHNNYFLPTDLVTSHQNTPNGKNELLGLYEQQLVSFYYLHINNQLKLPFPTLYFPIKELGENKEVIYPQLKYQVKLDAVPLPLIIKRVTDTTLHLDHYERAISLFKTSALIQKVKDDISALNALSDFKQYLPSQVTIGPFPLELTPQITLPSTDYTTIELVTAIMHFLLLYADSLVEQEILPEGPSEKNALFLAEEILH